MKKHFLGEADWRICETKKRVAFYCSANKQSGYILTGTVVRVGPTSQEDGEPGRV